MKRLVSVLLVTAIISASLYITAIADAGNVTEILSENGMTVLVKSEDFTEIGATIDTEFWTPSSGVVIENGTLKIPFAKSLSQKTPAYQSDYAVDITFTFPRYTGTSPDYNGPEFFFKDSSNNYYRGLMQWNNMSYYDNSEEGKNKFSVTGGTPFSTYAANAKDDPTDTSKEGAYLHSHPYRMLFVIKNKVMKTYLLDVSTGNLLMKFNDYQMVNATVGEETAFSLRNALSYALTVEEISMYNMPDTSFTTELSQSQYINVDDSVVFDLNKEIAVSDANGISITDSKGNSVNSINVQTQNSKMTVSFDKTANEKYTIAFAKDTLQAENGFSLKKDQSYTIYTLSDAEISETFTERPAGNKISIPPNSKFEGGLMKMGQYTFNSVKVNAPNQIMEFDLNINDTVANPELWYLFRITEKNVNAIISPNADTSEVLKLRFAANGLIIRLSDKNTQIGTEVTVPQILNNGSYSLRIINIEKSVIIEMKDNGVWKPIFKSAINSDAYSSYSSFNWRGTSFAATIDNLKLYTFGDTYTLSENVLPLMAGAYTDVVLGNTVIETGIVDESAFSVSDGTNVIPVAVTEQGNNTYRLSFANVLDPSKTYTVSVNDGIKSIWGSPFRAKTVDGDKLAVSSEDISAAFDNVSVVKDGSNLNITAEMKNFGATSLNSGKLIAAVFEDGEPATLYGIDVVEVTDGNEVVAAGSRSFNFTVDVGSVTDSKVKVKLLGWNDLEKLTPFVYAISIVKTF